MMTGIESSSTTGGVQACPVCTLYLREGISLQKHLDTHPKEQVIEALIRASSGGGLASLLGNSQGTQQTQIPPQAHQQSQIPTTPPGSLPTGAAQGHHIPAHSSYPVAPIYEGMPINAMMPPQFASFSYQQFVNNGEYSEGLYQNDTFEICSKFYISIVLERKVLFVSQRWNLSKRYSKYRAFFWSKVNF